jgi:hypothetical protein
MVTFEFFTKENISDINITVLIDAFGDKVDIGYSSKDILESIQSGQSILVTCSDTDGYIGFFVLSEQQKFDGLELFIWVAHSVRRLTDSEIAEIMGVIQRVGLDINADRVTFSSYRNGWLRRAKDYGFKRIDVKYGVEL